MISILVGTVCFKISNFKWHGQCQVGHFTSAKANNFMILSVDSIESHPHSSSPPLPSDLPQNPITAPRSLSLRSDQTPRRHAPLRRRPLRPPRLRSRLRRAGSATSPTDSFRFPLGSIDLAWPRLLVTHAWMLARQYRSEMVQHGGADVGGAQEGCTHLVVSGLVYVSCAGLGIRIPSSVLHCFVFKPSPIRNAG